MHPLTEVRGPVLNIAPTPGNIVNMPRSRRSKAKLSEIPVDNEENSQVLDEVTIFHGHHTVFSEPQIVEETSVLETEPTENPEGTNNVYDIPSAFTRLDLNWDIDALWKAKQDVPSSPEEDKQYDADDEEDQLVLSPFNDFFDQNFGIDDVISRDIIKSFSDEWSNYLNISDDSADNTQEKEEDDEDKENNTIYTCDEPIEDDPLVVRFTIYSDEAYKDPNQYIVCISELDPRFRAGVEYKVEKEDESGCYQRVKRQPAPTLSAWVVGSYMYDLILPASPSHIRLLDLTPFMPRLLHCGIVPTGYIALFVVEDSSFIIRAECMGWVVVRQDITEYCCLTEKYGAGARLALEQITDGYFDMKDLEWRKIMDVGF